MRPRLLLPTLMSCLLCGQVDAQQMTRELCENGASALAKTLQIAELGHAPEQSVDARGWCVLKGSAVRAAFSELRWRAEAVETAIDLGVPPAKFQVAVSGIDLVELFDLSIAPGTRVGPGKLDATLAHDPELRQWRIDGFRAEIGDLGTITGSARAGNVDFSNRNTMLLSLGSARLHDVNVRLENRGLFSRVLLPTLKINTGQLRGYVNALAAVLPRETMDRQSWLAVESLLNAMPSGHGDLVVIATSEYGLGVPQVAMGITKLEETPAKGEQDLAPALAILLDGVDIDVTWEPRQ